MAKQKTVDIVNIKRSKPDKKFTQTIMESIWLRKEAKLREQGWFLETEIKEVKTVSVDDGKGIETFGVEQEQEEEVKEEEVKEEEVALKVVKEKEGPYSKMSKAELQRKCDLKEIKYHHATKVKDLINLLEA